MDQSLDANTIGIKSVMQLRAGFEVRSLPRFPYMRRRLVPRLRAFPPQTALGRLALPAGSGVFDSEHALS